MAAINIRIEEDLKKQFQDFCDEMGFSTSAMLKGMIKKVTREKKIEFSGLTESGFTPEYKKEVLDYVNSESYKNGDEDVFTAETDEDIEYFHKNLDKFNI